MSSSQIVREATHAGSWYTDSKSQLNKQLEGWLGAVQSPLSCIGPHSSGETLDTLPPPGARVIIAPYVISRKQDRSLMPVLKLSVGMRDMPTQDQLLPGHTNAGMYHKRE